LIINSIQKVLDRSMERNLPGVSAFNGRVQNINRNLIEEYGVNFVQKTQEYHSYLHNVGGLICNINWFADSIAEEIKDPLASKLFHISSDILNTYETFYKRLPECNLDDLQNSAKEKYAGTYSLIKDFTVSLKKQTLAIKKLLLIIKNECEYLLDDFVLTTLSKDLEKLNERIIEHEINDDKRSMVNLESIINAAAKSVKNRFHHINFLIDKNCDRTISANRIRIEQVFENLFKNSAEKIIGSGTIFITIHDEAGKNAENPWCVVTVIDDGSGINEEDLPKIFDYGFSSKNKNSNNMNKGIGLAFVKQVLDDHNGTVIAGNEPGKGAKFKIYFPLTQK
jgi:signal transduction histidine kinase